MTGKDSPGLRALDEAMAAADWYGTVEPIEAGLICHLNAYGPTDADRVNACVRIYGSARRATLRSGAGFAMHVWRVPAPSGAAADLWLSTLYLCGDRSMCVAAFATKAQATAHAAAMRASMEEGGSTFRLTVDEGRALSKGGSS